MSSETELYNEREVRNTTIFYKNIFRAEISHPEGYQGGNYMSLSVLIFFTSWGIY